MLGAVEGGEGMNEATVEEAALEWLRELGYVYAHGPDISPGGSAPERASFTEVVLVGRLRAALERLNPRLSAAALDDAARQVLDLDSPDPLANNRRFHDILRLGVPVEEVTPEGERRGLRAQLFDVERPERNDWLAVNQFTIADGDRNRRPDIVIFVNGLPLALFELKNPLDPNATVEGAYQQLQTYKSQIPAVFTYNEILVVSDLAVARHGTLTSDWSRFAPWRTIDGASDAPAALPELEVLVRGMFALAVFLDLVRNFVVYETSGPTVTKIMTMYHQYHGVATVHIYYEGRLARLHLTNELIDEDFEDVTEGQEDEVKGKLRSRWARLEAMVGTPERLRNIADDLVAHYHKRSETLTGKAMIVCMSRRICVELYDALQRVPGCPQTAVVMTGSATDPPAYQRHLYSHVGREDLKERFKRPDDPLTFVIVRDMWLTGFDAPVLHTMYIDKPMQGHNLMQAVARVNRVFRDKPGGLIVDYIGIADDLKRALAQYTERDRDEALLPIDVALDLAREKHDVVSAFFHGIDYRGWTRRSPAAQVGLLQAAVGAVCGDDETKQDFLRACAELTKAFALVNARPEVDPLRDDVVFFQAVRRNVVKYAVPSGGPSPAVEAAVKQLVSESVASTGVVDIFDMAGRARPDISILSDAFLDEVRDMPHPNVRFEALRKLLQDEITGKMRRNVVTYRLFKERLEESIKSYLNRSVQSSEVIQALVQMALELRGVENRAEALGLNDEEVAFYDVLATGGTEAIEGSEPLRALVQGLVAAIKGKLSIDWTDHESTRAGVRVAVKHLLRRSRMTPAEIEALLPTIMEQAESLYRDWPMAA